MDGLPIYRMAENIRELYQKQAQKLEHAEEVIVLVDKPQSAEPQVAGEHDV